jgi:hypothetical protein
MVRSRKRTKTNETHVIDDSLRKATDRAFKQIMAAQNNLDLQIKKLRQELWRRTFKPPWTLPK